MIDLVLMILEMVGNRCSNCEFVGLKASYKALLLWKKKEYYLALIYLCVMLGCEQGWQECGSSAQTDSGRWKLIFVAYIAPPVPLSGFT